MSQQWVSRFWCCVLFLFSLGAQAWAVRWERDDTGRSVAVPDHVHRVVSLAPSITDTVYALGAAGDLAGITDYTIYPPQAAHEKPSVGAIVNPSLERIVDLHPDLVLALPAFNGSATIAGIQRLGIPVFLFTTVSIADIYRNVEDLGRLLGREPEAASLVAQLRGREESSRRQSQGESKPHVLLVYSIDPLITAGRKAFITEMIEAAGAQSVTDDINQDWLQMSLEAMLPRNPDYILLMKSGAATLGEMRQRAGWKSLRAVQRGRVIEIDDRIEIPAPVAFDALEDLARKIHAVQPR